MDGGYSYHPVLEGHWHATQARHFVEPDNQDVLSGVANQIDSTPRFVAGIVLGAMVVLVGLRAAGFRFVVGVNVGK
jgi:hypothetical protein